MPDPCFPTSKVANRIALYYIERPDHSKRLRELMEELTEEDTPRVVLLHGLAGSGKTQLASRYAKEWLRDHSYCYWFDASSLEILKAGFVDFFVEAGMTSTSSNPDSSGNFGSANTSSIQLSVRKTIQYISKLNEKWLLIFDNYDLPEKDWFDLRSYFPEGQNGQIIVTSRNRDVEKEVGGHVLHIDKMNDQEAIRLLLKSAGLSNVPGDQVEEDLKKLIATGLLGSLPLAIAQGGAFIRQRRIGNSHQTLKRLREYREIFEDHQAKMLAGELGGLVRQYGKSVITSWDMSFQVVIADNPTAAELLLFLGFLHHADIPERLFSLAHDSKTQFQINDEIDVTTTPFRWAGEILSSNRYGQWDKSTFQISMAVLESFSLIRSFDGTSYHMHPLVHAWTRVSKLGNQDETEGRARLGVAMLAKVYRRDVDRYSSQRRLQERQYTSHLASCLTSIQRHTNLLSPDSSRKLAAITLMQITNVLDSELLPAELRAQKFIHRLQILALMNGAQRGGLDQISTLQSLRNVLVDLGGDPRYAHAAEPLIDIFPTLLPIAASADHTVDIVEQELSFYFLKLGFLRVLHKTSELRTMSHTILEFLESHREDLGTREYLFQKVIMLNAWGTMCDDDELPSYFERVEDLIPELERCLAEADSYYILIAKKMKADCLGRMGKKKEAIELLRSNLAAAKVSIGVSNNLVSQNTYALGAYLIGAEEYQELSENSKYLLERISKELGLFHEDALLEKRRVIEFERKYQDKLGMLGKQLMSDPNIFGLDHCLQLPELMIVITLELAIAYKAFKMDSEIKPLWEGVLKQACHEETGEELISLYIEAFRFAMEAAHRQGYHYYGRLFETSMAQLKAAYEESRKARCEPRITQLERLRLLWDELNLLYDTQNESTILPGTLHIAENVVKSIRNAPNASQPAMLFLVNHFFQWMIQSEKSTTSAPVPCRTLEILEELSIAHFGHWKESNNTLRATVNLIVSRRLLGEEFKVIETENEMIRCRIEDEKTESPIMPGRQKILIPGTLGIERLNIEYRRRQWYSASVRLYQLAYDDFYYMLGLKSEVTIHQMQFLCEMYGRLSEFDMIDALLAKLESDVRGGDVAKKEEILNLVSAASRWCCLTGVFESSWHLIFWLMRCFFSIAALTWRIQILKDAEFVADKTGRPEEVPDLVELREKLELIYKTGNDSKSIEVPTGRPEIPRETPLTAEQLNKRFKFMCQIFARHRDGKF
jgi:hypothetical protein